MDRPADQPLTVETAKARLRETASRVGVRAWVHRHPLQTLLIAAAGGFVIARTPNLQRAAASGVLQGVIRALL
jgi:hypothetical protein